MSWFWPSVKWLLKGDKSKWSSSLLGNNITYNCISNAYEKAECVWLLFHNEQLTMDRVYLSGSGDQLHVTFSTRTEEEKVFDKVKLPFSDYHYKPRNSKTEYITVLAKNHDGEDVIVCANYSIEDLDSFIITKDATIKPKKYGDSNIFMDEDGVNHAPR